MFWRDGRVGLRRTTGNRVTDNTVQGFESLSLRHQQRTSETPVFSGFFHILRGFWRFYFSTLKVLFNPLYTPKIRKNCCQNVVKIMPFSPLPIFFQKSPERIRRHLDITSAAASGGVGVACLTERLTEDLFT